MRVRKTKQKPSQPQSNERHLVSDHLVESWCKSQPVDMDPVTVETMKQFYRKSHIEDLESHLSELYWDAEKKTVCRF